jgi:queuine tRNA-ribosyltransferase
MPAAFQFHLIATDGAARCGEIMTSRGRVATPAFMPVGTQATVKGMLPEAVRAGGADIVLGNTYHLMLRPGAERIAALGGLHKFMNWPHPILTDSGGFQVMSLSGLRKVEERAVTFRSHLDGAMIELTPERAIEIQALLDSDIAMQLDECIRLPAPRADIERAMRLSLRWAERSRRAFEALRRVQAGGWRVCARSSIWTFTAMRSAGSRSARRPRRCSRRSKAWHRRCPRIGPAI